MPNTTVKFGILLIALGLLGYLRTSGSAPAGDADAASVEGADANNSGPAVPEKPKRSVTALIPAFVGGGLLLCGVVALNEGMRMHAMHAAAAIGLLGCLAASGRGVMGIGKLLSDDPSLNQRSFLFVWLMAILCGIFVFLCVQSFRAARKQREEEAGSAAS